MKAETSSRGEWKRRMVSGTSYTAEQLTMMTTYVIRDYRSSYRLKQRDIPTSFSSQMTGYKTAILILHFNNIPLIHAGDSTKIIVKIEAKNAYT